MTEATKKPRAPRKSTKATAAAISAINAEQVAANNFTNIDAETVDAFLAEHPEIAVANAASVADMEASTADVEAETATEPTVEAPTEPEAETPTDPTVLAAYVDHIGTNLAAGTGMEIEPDADETPRQVLNMALDAIEALAFTGVNYAVVDGKVLLARAA